MSPDFLPPARCDFSLSRVGISKIDLAGGRKSGLTNYCAFGPRGLYLSPGCGIPPPLPLPPPLESPRCWTLVTLSNGLADNKEHIALGARPTMRRNLATGYPQVLKSGLCCSLSTGDSGVKPNSWKGAQRPYPQGGHRENTY